MEKFIEPLPHKPRWSPHIVFSWFGILLPPAIYLYLIYSYSLNLPFADDFAQLDETIRLVQSTNFAEKFSIIFAPHNEHRVVFNRLAFTLSYVLFDEIDFRILAITGNIALLALLFLFFKILKTAHTNLLYFIPVSILLFQLQFWKNMTWAASALQNQYVLFLQDSPSIF